VGTTIFTIMSRRARELDALNLGQGFPDYDIDPRLTELVAAAMRAGHNQYAPMEGLPLLRARIAEKLLRYYGINTDPESEITVTLGATEAIFSAIQAAVGVGDEVIAFGRTARRRPLSARAAHTAGFSLRLGAGAQPHECAYAARALQQPAQSGLHHRQHRRSGCVGGADP
jgi:histidinol-phosphate/aromatic aminotransferase/cobyric acid decarboxylase-like protein